MKRRTSLWALLLALLLLLTPGCGAGGNSSSSTAAANDAYMESSTDSVSTGEATVQNAPDNGGGGPSAAQPDTARKIIFSASLTMETTQYDTAIQNLERTVEFYSGWVEESNTYSDSRNRRHADYTLRIPSAQFREFLDSAGEIIGHVTSKTERGVEITQVYYDSQARLTSLQVQEERLLAILEKAEVLTDVIELEQALSDVRYEIERISSELRLYDSQVEMSTIQLSLTEVSDLSPQYQLPTSLGQRISNQMQASFTALVSLGESLLVLLVGNLPVLLILAVLITVVWWLIRRFARKHPKLPPSDPPNQQ
ncbi:MAG: DUF4349 domain-containing protein [Eubacteriales bacterium]|jgi:YD repeat-containing protein